MFYWWGSADFIVLNHSAAGPMVLKAPLVTYGCAAISALWLCRWEVELSNSVIGYERRGMCKLSALHGRECPPTFLPHASACRCRPNSTTAGNGIGCVELYFLDSVPLVGVACHHNSSSAHLIPSRPYGSAAGRLKVAQGFRVFSVYYRGLHSPRHTSSSFTELGLWETGHATTMHPPHNDVAP